MHSNHFHPMAEAEFLTLYILCVKTFVYTENDDVFSTVTPGSPTRENDTNRMKQCYKLHVCNMIKLSVRRELAYCYLLCILVHVIMVRYGRNQ